LTTAAIDSQLSALRSRIRCYLAISGLGRLAVVTVGYCAATLVLDWWFDLAGATRSFFLVLGLFLIGATFVRFLVKPFLLPLDADNLALLVEQHFPELRERLISAVQFERGGQAGSQGVSQSLIRAVLASAEEAARSLEVKRVLSSGTPLKLTAAALAGCVLAGAYCHYYPGCVAIWAQRLFNPVSTAKWPRKIQLEVVGVEKLLTVAKGEDLSVEIALRKGNLSQVTIDYVHSSGGKGIRRLRTGPDGLFKALFPRVSEPMKFRARGGDDETPWYAVEVVDRPRVERVQVSVEYPSYTGLPQEVLADGQGEVSAVVGTTVRVRARTDQPIAAGWLAIEDGESVPLQLDESTHLGGQMILQLGYTAYRIEVETPEGIRNGNPLTFKLQVLPDKPPVVRIQGHEARQDYTTVARVPLNYSVVDDYGLGAVRLRWQVARCAQTEGEPSGAGEKALPDIERGAAAAEGLFSWDLKTLDLKEGRSVKFRLEAEDLDDLNGPNVGRSPEYVLTIVSQAKLEAKLVQKERAVRRELERLRKQQEATRDRADGVMDALDSRHELDTAEQEAHVKAELEQRQLGRDTEKLHNLVDSMLKSIESNELTGFERVEGLREVKDDLRGLYEQEMPLAAQLLHEARDQSQEARPEREKLKAALERQTEAIQKLDQMLARMGESDELDQLIHLARALTNRQERINRDTKSLALQILGKASEDLTKDEQETVRGLARDQKKAIEAMKSLEEKTGRLADRKRKDNPDLSQQLTAALAEARRDQIRSEMGRIKEGIENSKLLSTLKPQLQVYRNLQKLLENLRHSKELQNKGADELRKALKASLEAIARLARDQSFVRNKLGRSQEESEALQKVRRQLDQLRKEQREITDESDKLKQTPGPGRQEKALELAGRQGEAERDAESVGKESREMSRRLRDTSGMRADKMAGATEELEKARQGMKKAQDGLRAYQLGESVKSQREAQEHLDKAGELAGEADENLEREREDETPRLADKQKEFSAKAKQIADQLEQGRQSEEAEKQKLGEAMSRAAEGLKESSRAMSDAKKRLEEKQTEGARTEQEKALQSLQDAFQNVAEALNKLSEGERQQKLAKLQQELEKMLKSQLEVNEVIEQAYGRWAGEGSLDRDWLLKLAGAAAREGEILRSGEAVTERLEEEAVPVFSWLLGTSLRNITRVKKRLEQSDIGHLSRRLAAESAENLRRLLALLQQQRQSTPPPARPPEAGGDQPPQPPRGEAPLIPPLAELRALRKLESEVYRATKAIEVEKVLYPHRKLAPWKLELLTEMADQQGELAKLAEIIARQAQKAQEAGPGSR